MTALASVGIAGCGDVPRPVTDAGPVIDARPALRTITVHRSHGGSGTITSSIGGIACGTACTANLADGITVTLTAVADPGSTFTGWTGPCTGSDSTCSFTVREDTVVGASFDLRRYTVTVALAGAGLGTVTATPGGLSCPGTCSTSVDAGTVITLIGTPAAQPPSRFVGWGTPMCTGTAPCILPINGDQTVTAIFVPSGCGNGVIDDPREPCDDGNMDNTDGCTNACQLAKCGDGFVWAGHEECDDGNTSNNDACTNACTPARCGDGFVWFDHEECDDRNGVDADACTNACKNARCGDGFAWAGHETCDDGNTSNNDACTNACQPNVCGDTHPWPGPQDCDDGNTSNNDACTNRCTPARCGDGFVWLGHEDCDDGNNDNNDRCDNHCHCGGPGEVCCAGGSACHTGNGCLQGICTACPVPTTIFTTIDHDGGNLFGVNNVHSYPMRCDAGHLRNQCIVTPISQPGGTSCAFDGWISASDPNDCGCNVRFITPADVSKSITCSITVVETTPHPDGCL